MLFCSFYLLIFIKKDEYYLRSITKAEAEYIRSKAPNIHIPATCKKKPKGKRKRRYIEETPAVLRLLEEYLCLQS